MKKSAAFMVILSLTAAFAHVEAKPTKVEGAAVQIVPVRATTVNEEGTYVDYTMRLVASNSTMSDFGKFSSAKDCAARLAATVETPDYVAIVRESTTVTIACVAMRHKAGK